MNFWDFFWLLVISFFFVAYLMVLFNVIVDVFRDQDLSGWAKAIWVLFLVFVPALTALVYIIVRGPGMAQRSLLQANRAQASSEAYIRDVAGTSPADQIVKAKSLLDAGTITQGEFDGMKAKALA